MISEAFLKKILLCLVGIIIGTALILPIQAKSTAKKKNATTAWTKKYAYSKKQCNKRFYTKTAINSKLNSYYKKTAVDTLLSSYYKKTEIDATLSSYYTETEIDTTLGGYYTKTDQDSRFINTSGNDSMSGELTASGFNYSSAQTKQLSLAGEAFNPYSDLVITVSGTNLGVYKESGTATYAVASVNFPNGAVVSSFVVYYYDNDGAAAWLQVQLLRRSLTSTNSNILADSGSVGGSGTPGYTSFTDSTIDNATIDNSTYAYFLRAVMSSTNANLTLRGARISYTVATP